MGRRCVSLLTRLSVRFIASDENGEIQPTRILNVSTEESYDLYENRFVYHLIQRLFTFVDKRTDVIFWSTGDETCNTMSMESKVDDAYEEISYKIEMTIKNRQSYAENDSDHMEVFKRIDRLRRMVRNLRSSSFCELMAGCAMVRSPIQRTNLMMKDPSYRTCYKLWQFIENYDEVGYSIEEQDSALEFDEIEVDEIFTPRVDVAAVDVDMDPEEVKNLFLTYKFSRMPVYEGQIDNVIGILHEREFLAKLLSGEPIELRTLAREALFIPQSLKISLALTELQKKKQQMAIVVDDYGGTAGVITVEDILEELVGEIWDEDEEIEEDVVQVSDRVYEVNAQANIYDVFDQVGVRYTEKELSGSNTVGGWILDTLQDIPEENETFSFHNVTVTVKEMEDQRIQTVWLEVAPEEEAEEEEE